MEERGGKHLQCSDCVTFTISLKREKKERGEKGGEKERKLDNMK